MARSWGFWGILLAAVVGVADTATNPQTGQRLEGRLLSTVSHKGQVFLLFKAADGKLHRLTEADWNIHIDAPIKPAQPKVEPFKWPDDIAYKSKRRDPAWLREQFAYFKTRLTIIDGQTIDIGRIFDGNAKLEIGEARKVYGRVLQVVSEESILLRYNYLVSTFTAIIPGSHPQLVREHAIIYVEATPTASLADQDAWESVLCVTGTHRYVDAYANSRTVLKCRPLPADLPPLTPEQFLSVLRSDFPLVKWLRRPYPPRKPGRPSRYDYRKIPID